MHAVIAADRQPQRRPAIYKGSGVFVGIPASRFVNHGGDANDDEATRLVLGTLADVDEAEVAEVCLLSSELRAMAGFDGQCIAVLVRNKVGSCTPDVVYGRA